VETHPVWKAPSKTSCSNVGCSARLSSTYHLSAGYQDAPQICISSPGRNADPASRSQGWIPESGTRTAYSRYRFRCGLGWKCRRTLEDDASVFTVDLLEKRLVVRSDFRGQVLRARDAEEAVDLVVLEEDFIS
jgi:hypothetical protein